MPLRKVTLRTSLEHRGQRLDHVLASMLPTALGEPGLSKAKVRKLIVAGAVYLNGKRVRIASKELMPNARLEIFVDLARLLADGTGSSPAAASPGGASARGKLWSLTPDRILFEDEFIIVADKPPGLPTQPTLDEARDNLFAAVKRALVARDGLPDPYVALHHRLDRDTSGVILLAKSKRANAGVAAMFAEHEARKTYRALVAPSAGAPALEAEWAVKNHLGKASSQGKRARFGAVRAGGDFAHTDFTLVERVGSGADVEARPLTGRTHQIRVHLAEAGYPIIGDVHYGWRAPGAGAARAPRVMLHALRLRFAHPVTGEDMAVEAPLPMDFVAAREDLRGRRP